MKIMQTIHQYDVHVFLWVAARKTRHTLAGLARIVSRTADGPLYLLLATVLYSAGTEPQRSLLHALLLAFACERPLYLVLKNVCRRNRPQAALNIPSIIIPSDHFYPEWMPLLFSWSVLVGMARVVLGVHFPTDTLVGALMGSSLALLSLEILL